MRYLIAAALAAAVALSAPAAEAQKRDHTWTPSPFTLNTVPGGGAAPNMKGFTGPSAAENPVSCSGTLSYASRSWSLIGSNGTSKAGTCTYQTTVAGSCPSGMGGTGGTALQYAVVSKPGGGVSVSTGATQGGNCYRCPLGSTPTTGYGGRVACTYCWWENRGNDGHSDIQMCREPTAAEIAFGRINGYNGTYYDHLSGGR